MEGKLGRGFFHEPHGLSCLLLWVSYELFLSKKLSMKNTKNHAVVWLVVGWEMKRRAEIAALRKC